MESAERLYGMSRVGETSRGDQTGYEVVFMLNSLIVMATTRQLRTVTSKREQFFEG